MKVLGLYENDPNHSPMSIAGKPVLEKMGAAVNFTLDYTSDKSVLNDANLAKYDLLLVINHFPYNLAASQQAAIQKFVEGGKGWIAVHSTGCERGAWPWFAKQIMGEVTWKDHHSLRQGTLLFEDRTHAITRNLPASTSIKEEWYNFNGNPRAKVRVLAKAGSTGDAAYDGVDHPLIWCSLAFPKAVYISPGHDPSDWTNPDFLALFRDAILFASPVSTRIKLDQANLGTPPADRPSAARVWFRNGIVHLGTEVQGGQSSGRFRPADAQGRQLNLLSSGTSPSKSGPPTYIP
jgi:type 1 glutamine amidotransferase